MSAGKFTLSGGKYTLERESLEFTGPRDDIVELLNTFAEQALIDYSPSMGEPEHVAFEHVLSLLGDTATAIKRPAPDSGVNRTPKGVIY